MLKRVLGFLLFLTIFISTLSVCTAKQSQSTNRLPGTSIASARLQADTLLSVLAAAGTAVENCKEVPSVINTKVTRKPQYALKSDGYAYASTQWNELWTVQACGKKVFVPIKFIPDSRGTAFSISVNRIRTE